MTPAGSVALLVVAVTYNSEDVLPGFARSLPAGLAGVEPVHVTIADNSPTDGSVTLARRLLPAATVLSTGGNHGYAAGINAALDASPESRAVLVLNPDVRLQPCAAARLLEGLAHPGTGIVVPRVVGEDLSLYPSLRRDPTLLRALGESVLGGRRAGRFAALGELVVSPRAYQEAGTFDWATGAALLISQECLSAVGRWDESFFLYSEETEFARRARDAGWTLRYQPAATVVHRGGDAATSPELWSLLTLNRVRLYRRYHGTGAAAAFRAALILRAALRWRRPTEAAALRALLHDDRHASSAARCAG